ncbi:MAG: DUF11 domain-containing protein [Methanimicrococcus sp.]|nr:DUF11 domain-containing protein [Methanimicrococcus sp.]
MKPTKIITGLLFIALALTALAAPAAAWETVEWVSGNDAYMVNTVLVEAGAIGVNVDDDGNVTGSVSLSIFEWRNDSWTKINGTMLSLNNSLSFTATDGNFTVTLVELRREGNRNRAKLEIWTNANVTNTGYIPGGHQNATGVGKPELVITKVVTPSDVSIGDLMTVTVYVHNTGNYDAKNVNISDPYPAGFLMMPPTINNTVNQTVNRNTNNTYLIYQIKSVEPGNYTLPRASATGENAYGMGFSYSQTNNATITVNDLVALTFASSPLSDHTVDHQMRTRVNGDIVVRNIGTMPAQFISIEFTLPDNATIKGENKTNITVIGNKATVYIDNLTPNNDRVISYSLSATEDGYYEVRAGYQYTYNNSSMSGELETVSFRATGNSTITKLLETWYLLLIPLIIIAVVAVLFLKKRNEYRF